MGKAKRDEEKKESWGAAVRLTRPHKDTPGAHTQSPGSQKGDILTSGSWWMADGSHPALPQSGLKHPIPVIVFFFLRLSSHLRWGCLAVFHSSWATAPPCGLAVGFLLRSMFGAEVTGCSTMNEMTSLGWHLRPAAGQTGFQPWSQRLWEAHWGHELN